VAVPFDGGGDGGGEVSDQQEAHGAGW
jgi:hypothetical protein